MFQFLNFNCWNLEQFSFPYFLANQILCKWSLDKMQRWWWATGSVSAGSRLATGDCKCSDLMFHHPMSSVEAGRGLVMASGRVGGSEGWEPLNTTPFGSPVVDALLWRLPVHSVEKKSFSAYCNFKKLDPWWRALSKASWDENWLFSPLLDGQWTFGWCESVLIGTWRLLTPAGRRALFVGMFLHYMSEVDSEFHKISTKKNNCFTMISRRISCFTM